MIQLFSQLCDHDSANHIFIYLIIIHSLLQHSFIYFMINFNQPFVHLIYIVHSFICRVIHMIVQIVISLFIYIIIQLFRLSFNHSSISSFDYSDSRLIIHLYHHLIIQIVI